MSPLGARIEPLEALLYDQARVGDLSKVVAPPYDLIGEARQRELYERSPYNIVRLELGRESDRYGSAVETMANWRRDGIIARARPAIYLYSQIFESGGRKTRRDGFVLRIRLEEFGAGRILPHEKTFPAAKADRLRLLTAIQTNVSSVFGLYSGNRPDLIKLICNASERAPIARFVDDLGIENHLRAIDAPDEIAMIQRALDSGRILIADGHHRYETALNYRRARREAEGNPSAVRPYDYTMMTLVGSDDPGLVILPTHRLVRKLDPSAMASFEERAREAFEISKLDSLDALAAEVARRGRGCLGVAMRGAVKPWIIRPRDSRAIESALPGAPPAVRELDVSVLHALVFDRIFGMKPEAVKAGGNIEYTIDARGALDAVRSATADGAFLMNPPTIGDVERVSDSGATMPEKSTYFYPKLITGLVMNPVGD